MFDEYGEHLRDLLAPWGEVSIRKMFGGLGVYRSGQIFAIVVDGVLYFKVADSNRADYQAYGSEPFVYEGKHKPVTMSYWQVPESVLEDAELLAQWAQKAYQAAIAAKSNQPARKKSARKEITSRRRD